MNIGYLGSVKGHSGMEVYSKKLYTALRKEEIEITQKEPYRLLKPDFLNHLLLEPFHMKTNEDLVHITNQDLFSGLILPEKPKKVVTVHDIFPYLRGFSGPFYSWMAKRYVHNLEKYADKIIAVSGFTKEQLLENTDVTESKIEVVYQGVDLKQFKPKKSESEFDRYYLHVGSELGRKNIPELIDLFEEIRENKQDAKLIRVGALSEDVRKHIEKSDLKLGEDIVYKTDISTQRLVELYSNAEKLLFPSKAEGFGRPMIESLACGTPVVAYNTKPMSEVLPKSMLVTLNSTEQFVEKSVSEQESAEECRKIAEKFRWSKTAERTVKIYQEMKKTV